MGEGGIRILAIETKGYIYIYRQQIKDLEARKQELRSVKLLLPELPYLIHFISLRSNIEDRMNQDCTSPTHKFSHRDTYKRAASARGIVCRQSRAARYIPQPQDFQQE